MKLQPPPFPARRTADATQQYSWSDQYPYGFGRTPTERLTNDLARVIAVHGVDQDHEAEAIELAGWMIAALELRRRVKEGK